MNTDEAGKLKQILSLKVNPDDFVYHLMETHSIRTGRGEHTAARIHEINAIDAAIDMDDLRLPGSNRLETLKGDRKGQWSIRINDRWRICFEWQAGDAEGVEIVDYH